MKPTFMQVMGYIYNISMDILLQNIYVCIYMYVYLCIAEKHKEVYIPVGLILKRFVFQIIIIAVGGDSFVITYILSLDFLMNWT